MKWHRDEQGWYQYLDADGESLAAVCLEIVGTGKASAYRWCVYIDEVMPPGDSQHRNLKEAKAEAERRMKCDEE